MQQRLKLIIPVVLIAGLGTMGWKLFGAREQMKPGAIAGNGVIEATEVDVSAKVSGRIVGLFVREGDSVSAGQLIAVLDSGELEGQVEQSAGNMNAAEAAYAELAAGTRAEDIRRAQAQYDAAAEALRQAQARRDLVYTGARLEQIAQLQAALEQAQARLSLVKEGPRPEQIAQLQAAYEQAQARLALVLEGPRKEQVAQLQASLDQAQVTLRDAETELQRVEKLYTQGAVAKRQIDQVTTRRDVAQAGVHAAKERLLEAKNGARPQERREAEASVEAARQRLAEAQRGARPQEIQEAQAAVTLARQRLAEAEHGARPQERQEADAAVAQAQAQVHAAKAALDLALAGPREETLAAARARVEQAKGAMKSATATIEQTKIIAPSAGRVTLRNVEPGELVTPGMPIVRLAHLDSVWMRIYVPEQQIGMLKLGQRATITTDAYTRQEYAGQIVEIAEEPEFTPKNVQTKEERVKQVFGVKIQVENPAGELKPGMPGDAVIYTRYEAGQ